MSVLSQISHCQGLGRKSKFEILKTYRSAHFGESRSAPEEPLVLRRSQIFPLPLIRGFNLGIGRAGTNHRAPHVHVKPTPRQLHGEQQSNRRRRHCFQTSFSSFGPSEDVAAEVKEAVDAPQEIFTFLNLSSSLRPTRPPTRMSDIDGWERPASTTFSLRTSSRLPQIIIGTSILVAEIFHIKLIQSACQHLILIGCPHDSRHCLVLLKFDPVIGRIVHEHVQGCRSELYRPLGHAGKSHPPPPEASLSRPPSECRLFEPKQDGPHEVSA